MPKRDSAAMRDGVEKSEAFIAVVTDNGIDSYFSREMCRQEICWAVELGKPIVPVVRSDEKPRIGHLIELGQKHGIDFSRTLPHLRPIGPAADRSESRRHAGANRRVQPLRGHQAAEKVVSPTRSREHQGGARRVVMRRRTVGAG